VITVDNQPHGIGEGLAAHDQAHGPMWTLNFGQDEDIERSKAAGFSEHLIKPVGFVHFRQVIDRFGTS
jgi:hypothetical protein